MFDPKRHCVVVVGAQWGDEGKGKIVDVLAESADLVVVTKSDSPATVTASRARALTTVPRRPVLEAFPGGPTP